MESAQIEVVGGKRHRGGVTQVLRQFRQELAAGFEAGGVCDVLGLYQEQRRDVLGDAGTAFVERFENETVHAV